MVYSNIFYLGAFARIFARIYQSEFFDVKTNLLVSDQSIFQYFISNFWKTESFIEKAMLKYCSIMILIIFVPNFRNIGPAV